MSKDRSGFGYLSYLAGGVVIGAGLALAADCFAQDRAEDQGQTVGVTRPANDEAAAVSTRVPFVEQQLSQEVQRSVQRSLVRINRTIKPGYEKYNFEVASCNGFVIGDPSGKPLVVSASHCFPERVKSKVDGKTYPAIDNKGQNVFKMIVTDLGGRQYEALPYNKYMGGSDVDVPDAILFHVPDSKFNPHALPLDSNTPRKWETYHRVSIHESEATYPFQYDSKNSDGMFRFFSVTKPDLACFPGTSGSPIVNRAGEAVGVLVIAPRQKITPEIASRYGLESGFIGKDIVYCGAVSAEVVKGLIRNQ